MNKRVLVTGGCGFIGKALTSSLLKLGYDVVIVDKDLRHISEDIKPALIIKGDVTSRSMWKRLPRCDYVFHLAAPSSVILFNADLDACIRTTTIGLRHAFDWARQNRVKKLIYPSSGSIFGRNNTDCAEETVPDPVNAYGKTKLICEDIAKTYKDSVPNLGLRIFAGYGPQEDKKGEISSVVTLFISDILAGVSPTIYGDGSQMRDFVYIDDIVDVMVCTMTHETVGVLNVGSGESTSFSQVVKLINDQLGSCVAPTYVHKPKEYLEKTACNPTQFRQILGRKITSLDEGIHSYLKLIGEL
jgi:UDP-glucose 4-epimerase